MDMMPTQDYVRSLPDVRVTGKWTIKERDPHTGLVVAEKTVKNVWTNYGLSNLASAISGSNTPPVYLVIESSYGVIQGSVGVGATSVTLSAVVDISGDTQLVLGVGTANQETVTFTSSSASGSNRVYNLSGATTKSHANGDIAVRQVRVTDTLASVLSESQYDPTHAATQRALSPGGYSTGNGQWTIQFYISGSTPVQTFYTCGLADSLTIGQGNLHNHFILGYNRSGSTNDIEIDGSITLSN